jgi:hypothetical protein
VIAVVLGVLLDEDACENRVLRSAGDLVAAVHVPAGVEDDLLPGPQDLGVAKVGVGWLGGLVEPLLALVGEDVVGGLIQARGSVARLVIKFRGG